MRKLVFVFLFGLIATTSSFASHQCQFHLKINGFYATRNSNENANKTFLLKGDAIYKDGRIKKNLSSRIEPEDTGIKDVIQMAYSKGKNLCIVNGNINEFGEDIVLLRIDALAI